MIGRETLSKNFEFSEDCNRLEVTQEEDGNVTNLDLNMFGVYVISSGIYDNREVYLSENGFYELWYNADEDRWAISGRNGEDKHDNFIYLDLNQDSTETDIYKSNGIDSWIIIGQAYVSVRCSLGIGKVCKTG